ncbi:head-tail connector protein [Anaerocolumna chitinilytica]|uniref:Uncharacterized protein n=1 Tax=Anaerocolumna chitinilytica TaxID=1727145 RepID=A0A7M3SAI5_9FIRM|nr:hypothetical protein [Anaerocolumna chitinilytica]BCK01603.1 hypothetical protein bsdcttw_46430 [Anaerocolumna chitinilytica]
MNNYANYAYYQDTYKGAVLDAASFDVYARQATVYLKLQTSNRVDDNSIPDEVKMCCCDISELTYKADKARHSGAASEKVGSYSVSYESNADIDKKLMSESYTSLIAWLGTTGLLYRGL